jgi:ribosomal protein S13
VHVEKVIDAAFNVDPAVPAALSKILGIGKKKAKKKK